ncbi:preprotein translocase subunit SecG [Mucilaginibacter limnophilus]|uniref:Protein-export membrane protein SecG n=1 Tax=Mucilaginibacter limnophilus TaxID=1932778 RepID=A0A437MW74_9SPHI|nr:preprotein translocase subunit SecG [Mucilaginibacter limnophilus]RVU01914.1 preprotein translocase subunit SecG [Mucilaginibacter limnophilus]
MSIFLVILAILVCILLGLIVLIQNPKGGGLASNFSSSSQLMGVQKTGDFLEKGTWILAITLMVLALAINVTLKTGGGATTNSEQQEIINKASKPTAPAAAPAALPGLQKGTDTSKSK